MKASTSWTSEAGSRWGIPTGISITGTEGKPAGQYSTNLTRRKFCIKSRISFEVMQFQSMQNVTMSCVKYSEAQSYCRYFNQVMSGFRQKDNLHRNLKQYSQWSNKHSDKLKRNKPVEHISVLHLDQHRAKKYEEFMLKNK